MLILPLWRSRLIIPSRFRHLPDDFSQTFARQFGEAAERSPGNVTLTARQTHRNLSIKPPDNRIIHGPAFNVCAATFPHVTGKLGDQHYRRPSPAMRRADEKVNNVAAFQTPMKVVRMYPRDKSDDLPVKSFCHDYFYFITLQVLL